MGGEQQEDSHKKRFTPYAARPSRGKQRVQFVENPTVAGPSGPSASAGEIVAEITGWDKGSEADLISFVQSKTNPVVRLRNISYSGPLLLSRLPAKEAFALRKISGLKFRGQKLVISLQPQAREGGGGGGAGLQSVLAALRSFVRKGWNPSIGMCDISSMGEDPEVRRTGVRNIEDGRRTGEAICALLGEECPDLVSLRADKLGMSTLQPLATLLQRCPKVVNLSVAHNRLQNLDALVALRNAPLNELILVGNPVREREVQKNRTESAKWRNDVRKIFPTLRILDDAPVEDAEEEMEEEATAGPAKASGLPLEVRPGFVDMEETKAVADDFVAKFFPLFDVNRNALAPLYHPEACFSLTTSINPVPGYRMSGRTRGDDMSAWNPRARSLKAGGAAKKAAQLHRGPGAIVDALRHLPATRHPAPGSLDSSVVDAWMVTLPGPEGQEPIQAVFLTIHGEFIELSLNLRKSFSRTFLIAPAAPGSAAAQAGWGYTILNDELHVRFWSTNRAWRDAVAKAAEVPAPVASSTVPVVAPPAAVPLPAVQQPQEPQVPGQTAEQALQMKAANNLTDAQHAIVIQIQLATRLNYPFAVQLLAESAWDAGRAMEMFGAARAGVPAEAFLPG
ncbi:hypothetical protein DFJ74DRAFT_683873 [Hyaloraphidium curvatum]|nr:hypothetical protein DFJ74DRAFT_683873 [Hyaloraphidium curvatum]